MYTYTPQENIEQAKLRIGDISLQDYINSANAIIQSSNTNREEEQSSSPNYSTAQVVGDTLGMVAKDVFNGLSKAFEGIADFGAGLVGSIAKWAGNESVEQAMADYVARDTTNEYVWNGMFKGTNQDFEASAINKMSETGQNIVRGVAQGVGGMIPTIAISLISRGAGASAGAASIASLTQMGISAAGTATEEALNDEVYDANGNRVNVQLDRAFLYGLASGCMEIATETIIGGAYEGIFGKGLLDGVVKNLTKSVKFGKLVGWLVNNLGEGVEEIVSAVFEDTLKTIYNSPDGKMHWKAPELQNVIESGIIGSLTSVVMGTSSQVLSRVSSKNTIGQSLQNISENNEWASNLQEKGRYDEKRATSVSQDNEKQLNTIEKRLKIMSDVKRARIMTQMPQLFNYFNNDGTRIAKQQLDSGVSLAENIEVGRQNGTFDARITDDNKVSNTLAKAEARLEGKEHLSIATNVDTDEQKNNLKVVKKLTDPIGRASGVPLKIVVFQSDVKDSQVNGFISGDTMYVNKDKLNNLSDIAKVWSHESLGHFTENTKEHSILIGQLKGAYEEMYNKVKDYIENRSNYQEGEYKSETEAHFIEAVFGGLDIIDESGKQVHLEADITNDLRDRIIAENSGAFKKLANRIKWIVEKLKATFTGDKKTLEYIERLDNIAKTIDSALAKGGTKVIADKVEKAADTILTSDRANRRIIAKIERIAKEYGIDLNASSRVINSINNRGIPTEYSLATWQENVIRVYDKPNKRIVMKSGRDILIEQLKNNGVSQEDIDKIVGAVDNVADIVLSLSEKFSSIKKFLNAKPYYRDDGSLMLSAIVSNGEYELNIDFTTICKKREQLSLFLQEYAELCQKEPEKYNWGKQGGFTNQAIEVLNNLFRKYDLDTACTMCFVEAKRQYFNDWANKIVMYWNAALKEKGITKVKPISKVEGLEKIDTLYGIKGEITEETMDKVGLEFSSDINRELAEQMAEEEKEKTYFKRMLQYIELNKTDPENHPLYLITKDDLLNSKVIAYLRSKAKDFYSFLLTAYGTANPKMMLPATPYASDLLNKNITYSTGGKPVLDAEIKRTRKAPEVKRDVTSFTADYIFGLGGARANSFSDFQISRVLDYVQFLADCSAKGFAVQTYTKELAMVELFGKTGIKGNISVVFEVDKKYMESFASEEEARDYAGLDKDGNYIVSIDSDKGYFEKADKLQNQEGIKGNWGIVGVGISKYHILKMLDDSRFKMIIPYHSSGMPLHLKVFYNHTYYKDYTDYQTTATADGKSISKDNPLKVKNGKTYKSDPFLDIFYKTYRETNGNYIAATQSYLDFCKEYNLRPRFTFEWDSNKTFEENIHSDGNYITNHPNYYKVLIDFTSDGGLDKDGKQIFKKQEAIDIKNAFDGVDIAGIIVEEATKLEQQYEKYNRAKQGIDKDGNKGDPIFELFCKALQGDLNDEDLKQIRDDRIEKENKENKVKSQNDIKASFALNEDAIAVDESNPDTIEYEQTIYFSLVTDKQTLDKLNNGETIKTYRAMQLVDGKLYPPMSAKLNGEWKDEAEIGKWYVSDEHPEKVNEKGQFPLIKGNGKTIWAAYNPYWHSSLSPLNDQFNEAVNRPNLVIVECEVPQFDIDEKYRAEKAKNHTGKTIWKEGAVSQQLTNPREVVLSRYIKVNRILSDSEVAKKVKTLLDAEKKDITIPYNEVTPQLRLELEKLGVKISPKRYGSVAIKDSNGNRLTDAQYNYFYKSKVTDNDGRLLVVYHGTEQAGFTEFGKDRSKSQFGEYKFGDYNVNYFTKDKDIARGYTKLGIEENGNIYAVYLNITNPYIVENKDTDLKGWNSIKDENVRKNQLKIYKNFIKEWIGKSVKAGDLDTINKELSMLGYQIKSSLERPKTDNSNYDRNKKYYDIYNNPNNTISGGSIVEYSYELNDIFEKDGILDEILKDNFDNDIYGYTSDDIVRYVIYMNENKGTNYDGIILKDVRDVGTKGDLFSPNTDDYITLKSANQIKSISNLNPSESDDIRFSLNPKERLEVIKTKDDIKQVVQSIFMDDDSGNPIVTYIAEEDNSEITRKILKEAPYVPENMVETFADEIAKNIIEKATYDKYFYEDDIDIQQLKQYKKNAARYRHKIRFSDSDKAELIHRYDRKGAANVLRFYSKKDGGLYLDQLIEDMYEDIGVQMPENESTIDLFFGWINEVDNISNQIDRATSEHRGQYTIDSLRLPYEKVEMIKDQIRERLVSVLEPYVANHQIERDNILEEERERLKAEYDKKVKANEMKLADAKKQMEEELSKRKIELDKQREQEVDNQVLQQTKKVVMEANRMVNESEKNLDKIKKENAEMKKRFKLLRRVTNKARWFRKENMKEFNKSSLQDEGIEQAVSGLSKIGNVNYAGGKGARQVVADYIEKFYNPEHRKMIGEQYQDDLYDDLKQIADNRFRKTKTGKTFKNNKDLSLEEIGVIQKMLLNAESIVKNYNQVKINKKYEKLDVKVKESLEIMKKFAPMLSDAKVIRAMRHLMAEAIEPRVVIKMLFGMQDNILSDLYEDIARGETKGKALQLHLDQMLQAFYKEHKKYGKTLSKIVMFRGQKMTKAQLLTLVKYYEQDHSKAAVLNTGWAITNEKTGLTEKVSGFIDSSKLLTQEEIDKLDADTLEELKEKRKAEQEKQAAKEMYDLLTEEDKQYLEKISDIMEEAAKMQIQTDIEFKGYSDINPETSRKYLPIKRYGGDFAVDSFKAVLDSMKVDQAGNQSISKARTRNQRHLQLFDIDTLVLNYAKQLGVYYGLAVPIKEFQRAYNFNVTDNINKPVSIRNTISEDVWDYAGKYITKLLGDIQGFDRGTSAGSRALSKLRSGYVTASLGLNIKVMLTQFASYPTAFSILRASSLAKAFTKKISFKEMDKYSDYANVRNALDDAAKSQGADGGFNGKLGNLAKASMWGIGKVDRFTIGMLWNACQFEIEARHKGDATYKFGTEENKKEAAILLEDVGRKTQPNYTTTERTGIQRSSSELVRWTLGSFTSVPSRMLSRLVETSMELRALWYRQHKLGESVSVEERRAIGTKFVKSVTAVTMSNLMYVLIAQALKFAFDKDRKDKEGNEIDWWEDMLIDFGSVNVGMIPFFKDLYSSFVQGYSYDGSTFSTGIISDLFAIGEDAMDMVTKSANGKATSTNTIMGWIKKMGDALGTLFGIPTRNVYNQLYGIIKRFVPSAAYQMNSIFYSTSKYSQDLRKAIEDGDTDLANTIMGLMLKEKGISRISDKATDKIRELYAKGYNILPRTIGDSVTIDGEEYGLSATQQQKIKSVYDQANRDVEKLIADNGFNRLDEKIQAKTIKWIYDYYYEYAVANTLGLTADSKKLLYGETMSVSRFALAISVCSSITPDKDRKGNNIAGTKKDKIIRTLRNVGMTQAEREMILAYLGYSVDENIISRYIRSLGLTRNQQTIFKSYMSFAA